jgi:predicted choloylglycine hydrolase
MPELIPHYDQACALVGDDELAHRIISHYRAPQPIAACSQAVWLGREGPALVRNYDYPLDTVSDGFMATAWSGRRVIAKAQRPWGGCLDGMNEDGLVASLTFGGSRARGVGFAVILIVRYVLESCRRVDEAVAALVRIPIAMAHNVTVLDASGEYATVFLRPDRAPAVTAERGLHQPPGARRLAGACGHQPDGRAPGGFA